MPQARHPMTRSPRGGPSAAPSNARSSGEPTSSEPGPAPAQRPGAGGNNEKSTAVAACRLIAHHGVAYAAELLTSGCAGRLVELGQPDQDRVVRGERLEGATLTVEHLLLSPRPALLQQPAAAPAP